MYLIINTALVLLFHQYFVNSFNIFNIHNVFNYLNKEINILSSSFELNNEIKTRWFLQEVDHFNPNDTREWKMKYFEGLKYWKESGPIYLSLGGIEIVSPAQVSSGIMNELAKETNGAMYLTEHRYYGDSKPFNISDVDDMKYLSSRQALADIAKLIQHLKSLSMYKDAKVVVIGGGYAGNLAAWMKVLYPELIDAAIAISAPVLAKKDFYEYLEKIRVNYENYGNQACLDKIKGIFEKYDSMLRSPEGIEQLKKDEDICDECDMTIIENQQLFFLLKTSSFMWESEYGTPESIKYHCEILNDKSDNRTFLKEYSKLHIENVDTKSCICNDFKELIEQIKEFRNLCYAYVLLYQTCTEFGYYKTTSSKNQPFLNIPLEIYIKMCSAVFGKDFNEKRVDEGVENTNKLYGGLHPNVTNVVFTNGDMDPWSTISVLQNLSFYAPAIVIPRTSHSYNLLDNYYDNKELRKARHYVKDLIKTWIGSVEYLN